MGPAAAAVGAAAAELTAYARGPGWDWGSTLEDRHAAHSAFADQVAQAFQAVAEATGLDECH